jgi:outer membrane protein TolC
MDCQRGIYTELVTIARAGNKLRVDFSASLGERNLGLKTLSATGTTWNAGLFATVPLFDGWRGDPQMPRLGRLVPLHQSSEGHR